MNSHSHKRKKQKIEKRQKEKAYSSDNLNNLDFVFCFLYCEFVFIHWIEKDRVNEYPIAVDGRDVDEYCFENY